MADWYVNQKVVCVDNEPGGYARRTIDLTKFTFPQCGPAYTIRRIIPAWPYAGFLLSEIVNPKWGPREAWFCSSRFRPVVIPEADIAQFEAILRGVEKRRLVDA